MESTAASWQKSDGPLKTFDGKLSLRHRRPRSLVEEVRERKNEE